MTVFYELFDRHAHGEGLKAHATHYCPGCGHGLAHRYLADAIEALGIQDRTVAVSPVGCAVFLHYYFDVGNTQAAHGRAPAVAIGHKLANPDSVVISYQGDGDLASIGLAEIMHAAQMGLPISVIFINNANYAMTGGQMAPTTLMGMTTTTTPAGRTDFFGQPMKVAELMATLDGPVYVERVALYDNKQRMKAKKAIEKALRLQVEHKGFSFVEVLSECPVQLKLDPVASQTWVKDNMVPVFPLGVKKDTSKACEPRDWHKPSYDPELLLAKVGAHNEVPTRHAAAFPTHLDPHDVALKLAGAGGDGAQTAALLLTRAAINEGFDSTHIPSYGPESRGGTSYADVHIAADEVLSPSAPNPHILLAFNSPSLHKFGPKVRPGGVVLFDSTVVESEPEYAEGVRAYGVPFGQIALDLGAKVVKNIVALGALQAATGLFPADTFKVALEQALHDKCSMIPVNLQAFAAGADAVKAQLG
ncbi:MAG: 2-oxoacid:acceptor oxidoreductase family protein [Myxococcales bacterium]|nr:2-oxoacid:acceptor oxidoreductase family protein [Myxococcales bacterium]